MSRVIVRERLFDSDAYHNEWPSNGPIDGLIEWLQKQRDSAPEEHRASVQADIGIDYGYENSCSLTMSVYYDRPERPNETQERHARERAETQRLERKEREKLAALKRKYER